jgi:spatacsin
VTSDDEIQYLQVVCDSKKFGEFVLQCGDVDGVVLGSWNTTMDPEVLEDTIPENENLTTGYLLVAAVWLQAWDQQTINRVGHSISDCQVP